MKMLKFMKNYNISKFNNYHNVLTLLGGVQSSHLIARKWIFRRICITKSKLANRVIDADLYPICSSLIPQNQLAILELSSNVSSSKKTDVTLK